jgi:putative membrane protein
LIYMMDMHVGFPSNATALNPRRTLAVTIMHSPCLYTHKGPWRQILGPLARVQLRRTLLAERDTGGLIPMMDWNDGSWGWGAWLFMAISMVAFWGLLAWLAVTLVRSTTSSPSSPSRSTAEDLLAERFARGEIDETDYQRRSTLLQEHRSTSTGA